MRQIYGLFVTNCLYLNDDKWYKWCQPRLILDKLLTWPGEEKKTFKANIISL